MIIAPSLLSFDFSNLSKEVSIFNELVEWYHYDVMDGNFVPNISFGPKILSDLKKITPLFIDAHLMVSNPAYYAEIFAKAGADLITFHYEALSSIQECEALVDKIHSMNVKAGISIKPNTKPEVLDDLLEKLDLVLVMSVEPGFGGQKFMESAYDKIKYYKTKKEENNYQYLIEVDGGVCDTNAKELVLAGAEVLVSGSYLTKNPLENTKKLRY